MQRAFEKNYIMDENDSLSEYINPIRSGGGGGFKSPPLRFFALTHLIFELYYCALVTFPKN